MSEIMWPTRENVNPFAYIIILCNESGWGTILIFGLEKKIRVSTGHEHVAFGTNRI
jgi:hypothetical protein